MSLADRKRAFLAVLTDNINGPECQEITRFWEEKYADRPQFGVSAFLDEVYGKYSIAVKKGQLFRQLSRAVMQADGGQARSSSDGRAMEPSTAEVIDRNGLKVFQALQDEFVALAKPVDRMKITSAQYEGVQLIRDASAHSISAVTKWLRGRATDMPDQLELGLLKKVFNLGYVEACHLYGPVKSDQMLNTALQKAGAVAESHIVPPVYFI